MSSKIIAFIFIMVVIGGLGGYGLSTSIASIQIQSLHAQITSLQINVRNLNQEYEKLDEKYNSLLEDKNSLTTSIINYLINMFPSQKNVIQLEQVITF